MKRVFSLLFSALLLSAPADAAKTPKGDYQLKLDNYEIDLVSYPFPSGLNVIFQEAQPAHRCRYVGHRQWS